MSDHTPEERPSWVFDMEGNGDKAPSADSALCGGAGRWEAIGREAGLCQGMYALRCRRSLDCDIWNPHPVLPHTRKECLDRNLGPLATKMQRSRFELDGL